eukprot:7337328-Pyramimonas_sp.AAC.1
MEGGVFSKLDPRLSTASIRLKALQRLQRVEAGPLFRNGAAGSRRSAVDKRVRSLHLLRKWGRGRSP